MHVLVAVMVVGVGVGVSVSMGGRELERWGWRNRKGERRSGLVSADKLEFA